MVKNINDFDDEDMTDFRFLKANVPQMIYELYEANDNIKFSYDLGVMSLHNLFQLYRNEVGNPDKYIKILQDIGFI